MKINKIVLITNNFDGAMLQMTGELVKDLSQIGYDVVAYLPSENNMAIGEEYKNKLRLYNFGNNKISKKINGLCPYSVLIRNIYLSIEEDKPDLIWTIDDKPFTSMLGIKLARNILTYMTVHDVSFHPSYKKTLRNSIYMHIWKSYREKYIRESAGIITMSQNGYNAARNSLKQDGEKVVCMQLGAHVPDVEMAKPLDFPAGLDKSQYNLFFGRIDKYKGIETLLESYAKYRGDKTLIVAGSGELKKDWIDAVKRGTDVVFINRYIDDSEMIWLISNANCVILPYIEASQSGVIPIAYSFGVPVITSNVLGLTQNVVNNYTGIVCNDLDEYVKAYYKLDDIETRKKMVNHIHKYYEERFDWKTNLRNVITEIESRQED